MEDLGLIKWEQANTPARSVVYPYRLPSKASAIIVKYRPRVAISCVIPPQKFNARYRVGSRTSGRQGSEEVVTPILLMTQTIDEMPSSIRVRGVTQGYSLWALQLAAGELSKTKEMSTSPYLFGNVWDKGAICFGGMAPQSLMQAFNYYWSSGFNDELYRDQGHHTCNSKSHNFTNRGLEKHIGCRCKRKFDHQCSCSRKTAHSHNQCGCSTVMAAKKCKGSCVEKLIQDNPDIKNLYELMALTFSLQGFPFLSNHASIEEVEAIPKGSQAAYGHWRNTIGQLAESRGRRRVLRPAYCECCLSISTLLRKAKRGKSLSPRQLAKYAVTDNEPYPGCGCTWRHKNTCDCSFNRCQCPCICECCLKTCGHPVCKCVCCRGECACPCVCSTTTKFKEHLKVYHDKILPNQPWKDRTTLFCGEAYWASPESSTAVLVTNHPYLLMHIPQQFRRRMADGEGIIALGKKQEEEDSWEFNSGTYTFRIPSSLVSAN